MVCLLRDSAAGILRYLRLQPFLGAQGQWRDIGRSRHDRSAQRLADQDIGVGVGHCYAYRLIEALGIDVDDGVVRTSLVHYTSPEEVERLLTALDQLL